MTLKEAIYLRQSIRSYQDKHLEMDVRFKLLSYIDGLNLKSEVHFTFVENDPSVFSHFTKSYGAFINAQNYIVVTAKEMTNHTQELAGYYGEHLVLYAKTLGLDTCFVGGTFSKVALSSKIKEDEAVIVLITIGYASDKESFTGRLMKKVLKRNAKPMQYYINTIHQLPKWLERGILALSYAPSAKNRQGIHLDYIQEELKISISFPAPFVFVDLGVAKANFEIETENGHFELGNDALYILNPEV